MQLESIRLTNFKNYRDSRILFSCPIIAVAGKNGMGKTNLLDAVYYLCTTRSYFLRGDQHLIHTDADFFRLEGAFHSSDSGQGLHQVSAALKKGEKKVVKLDEVPYERLADHIGQFPVVFVAPDDIRLVSEFSQVRRAFMDQCLSQTDRKYLDSLMSYRRILKQRNAYLQNLPHPSSLDMTFVKILDEKLEGPATYLHETRKNFTREFEPVFREQYEHICEGAEIATIEYQSDLNSTPMNELLTRSHDRDVAVGRTTRGIHKDDLKFRIRQLEARKFGSQGQVKSFVMAVKFAQYFWMIGRAGEKPIMIIDDIFDKLDADRVRQIFRIVRDANIEQTFISDTHEGRLKEVLESLEFSFQLIFVENGSIVKNETT